MVQYPRSAYDRTLGLVYFARMLDKIRLQASGLLPCDYLANLGIGFDGWCCRFLGVDYEALRTYVLTQNSDETALEWCFSLGRRPSREEIEVWNAFMTKRGWRDEVDGSSQKLKAEKERCGLVDHVDIVTWFDFYEVDEGRSR